MIVAEALVKAFRGVRALNGLSLQVGAGELFGLLGPNGAGKTTAVQILCGLVAPDSGTARVGGFDVRLEPQSVRAIIGLVHQVPSLDRRFTVLENLDFHCRIYHIPRPERRARIEAALRLAGLTGAADRVVAGLSGGMKRRLEIARALMHRPRILFLDEPTIGLDPAARSEIWSFVSDLRRREGVTVLFTTHYLDEAELCDRVAILDRGQVVAAGSPADLRAAVLPPALAETARPQVTLEDAYLQLTGSAMR